MEVSATRQPCFSHMRHPYTQALLESMPDLGEEHGSQQGSLQHPRSASGPTGTLRATAASPRAVDTRRRDAGRSPTLGGGRWAPVCVLLPGATGQTGLGGRRRRAPGHSREPTRKRNGEEARSGGPLLVLERPA